MARRNAPTNQTAGIASGELQPEVLVVNYEATAASRLALNQTLATGGWLLSNGNRCVMFAMPKINAVDGDGTVEIQTRFVELLQDAFVTLELDGVKAGEQKSSAQLILDAEQAEEILEGLQHGKASAPRTQVPIPGGCRRATIRGRSTSACFPRLSPPFRKIRQVILGDTGLTKEYGRQPVIRKV